jgi:hypothetical protein
MHIDHSAILLELFSEDDDDDNTERSNFPERLPIFSVSATGTGELIREAFGRSPNRKNPQIGLH